MTFILGVIIGVAVMWLRDIALAKPSSPLLRLPASELRAILSALHEAHAQQLSKRNSHLAHGLIHLAGEAAGCAQSLRLEIVEVLDALRIVEAREERAPAQGAYR